MHPPPPAPCACVHVAVEQRRVAVPPSSSCARTPSKPTLSSPCLRPQDSPAARHGLGCRPAAAAGSRPATAVGKPPWRSSLQSAGADRCKKEACAFFAALGSVCAVLRRSRSNKQKRYRILRNTRPSWVRAQGPLRSYCALKEGAHRSRASMIDRCFAYYGQTRVTRCSNKKGDK